MNKKHRTLYSVLGVSPEAPDTVIKAAYRALAKQYHPDANSSNGDQSAAFLELQSAYEVLSDPSLRAAYDRQIGVEEEGQDYTDAEEDTAASIDPDETWAIRRNEYPNIDELYDHLSRYSVPLANHFRLGVIGGDFGSDPELYADGLEAAYFNKYFGSDPRVQALARTLLTRNLREAAKELNEAQKRGLLSGEQQLRAFVAKLKSKYGLRQDTQRGADQSATTQPVREKKPLRGLAVLLIASVAVFSAFVMLLQSSHSPSPSPPLISPTSEAPSSGGTTTLTPQVEIVPPSLEVQPKDGASISDEVFAVPDTGSDTVTSNETVLTPQLQPSPEPQASASQENQADTRPLPPESITTLVQRIRTCWIIPAGAREANIKVKLKIKFNRDGSLASTPEVLNGPGDYLFGATARSAIEAVTTCQKYNFFPPDQYGAWKELTLNFDPNMFATDQ